MDQDTAWHGSSRKFAKVKLVLTNQVVGCCLDALGLGGTEKRRTSFLLEHSCE